MSVGVRSCEAACRLLTLSLLLLCAVSASADDPPVVAYKGAITEVIRLGDATGTQAHVVPPVDRTAKVTPSANPVHCPMDNDCDSLEPEFQQATTTDHWLGASVVLGGPKYVGYRFVDASGSVRHRVVLVRGYTINGEGCSSTQYGWTPNPLQGNNFYCFSEGTISTFVDGYPHGSPGRWRWEFFATEDDAMPASRTVQFDMMPAALMKLSGDGQQGVVGHTLLLPLVPQLKNAQGDPVSFPINGRTQSFTLTVDSPGGASGASASFIGASYPHTNGTASIRLLLGNKVGTYRVRVKHPDSGSAEAVFTATAIAEQQGEDNGPDNENADESGDTSAEEGDPINVANGNNHHVETDYPQVGLSPLEFKRSFNSVGGRSRLMDNYWTTSYDRYVLPPPAAGQPAYVQRPGGARIRYAQVNGQFVAAPHFLGRLEQVTPGWRYTNADGSVETFDATGKLQTITDLRGRVQTASYNSAGRLSRVTANTGEYLGFEYNAKNRLSALVDHTNRRWTYTYDSYVNLTQVLGPDGIYRTHHHEATNPWMLTGVSVGRVAAPSSGERAITWTYDGERRATSSRGHAGYEELEAVTVDYRPDGTRLATLSDGSTRLYSTSTVNGRTWVTSVAGAASQQGGALDLVRSHDGSMNITASVRHGRTAAFESYDAKRQPRFRVDAPSSADERRVEFEYDPRFVGKPTLIREPSVAPGRQRTTTITYNPQGLPTSVTVSGYRPDGVSVSRASQYEYNGPFAQLSRIDGPRTDIADITRFEYHATTKRLQRVIDANNTVIRDAITYTPTGRIKAETRPNGVSVTYEYHAGSELLKSIRVAKGTKSQTTAWTYDDRRRVASITFSNGVDTDIATSFTYNAAGKLTRLSSPNGMSIEFTIDSKGNVDYTRYQDSSTRRWIDRTFDAYNRVDKVIEANSTIDYDFKPDGTLDRVIDGKGRPTNYTYDDFRRLTRIGEVGPVYTTFDYDVHGRLTEVVDPINATTRYQYDDLGNRLSIDSPDTGVTRFEHDAAGNVVSILDALDRTTLLSYDAANRVRTINRAGTDYDETYTYDTCVNGIGRLCAIANGIGEDVAFEYDAFGRVSKQTTDAGSIGFAYDAAGNVVRLTYPSGRAALYDYNAAGQVARVRVEEGGVISPIATSVLHEPFGPARSWTFGNGLSSTQSFDAQYWLRGIQAGSALQITHSSIDRNGNITARTVNGAAHQYTYDFRDRLDTATGPFGSRDYGLDANGNRVSLVSDGILTTTSYEPSSNRIDTSGEWNYSLDAVGNTVEKRKLDGSEIGQSYAYSAHNRLIAVYDLAAPTVPLATYRYNPLGQRASKAASGVVTSFIYGRGAQLLAELDATGIREEYVYLEGRPIAMLGRPQAVPPPPTVDLVVDNPPNGDGYASSIWVSKRDNLATNGEYLYTEWQAGACTYKPFHWLLRLPVAGQYDYYIRFLSRESNGVTVYDPEDGGFNSGEPPVYLYHAGLTRGSWVKVGSFQAVASKTIEIRPESSCYAGGTSQAADAIRAVLTQPTMSTAQHYRYIHTDHLGAPVVVTGPSGAVQWRAAFDPFGAAVVTEDPDGDGQTLTLPLRFPGQYNDAESNLVYNHYRTYDPILGRYLESDPTGLGGGVNTYAYAGSNPMARIDPWGLAWEDFSKDDGGHQSFDRTQDEFHAYDVWTEVCGLNTHYGCDPTVIFEEGLRRHTAPFLDGVPVENLERRDLFLLGPVRFKVYEDQLTIINETVPGHDLHPGFVLREIEVVDGRVFIHTHGEGVGALGAANEAAAIPFWRFVDLSVVGAVPGIYPPPLRIVR